MINYETTSYEFASKPHPSQQNSTLYSAIFTVNMSKLSLRLFELFTFKSVKQKLTPSMKFTYK